MIPYDMLFIAKQFLENRDIIELLCTCHNIRIILRGGNLFTSITITNKHNLFLMYRFFMAHKKSIILTILKCIDEPELWWPFISQKMSFIECDPVQNFS